MKTNMQIQDKITFINHGYEAVIDEHELDVILDRNKDVRTIANPDGAGYLAFDSVDYRGTNKAILNKISGLN